MINKRKVKHKVSEIDVGRARGDKGLWTLTRKRFCWFRHIHRVRKRRIQKNWCQFRKFGKINRKSYHIESTNDFNVYCNRCNQSRTHSKGFVSGKSFSRHIRRNFILRAFLRSFKLFSNSPIRLTAYGVYMPAAVATVATATAPFSSHHLSSHPPPCRASPQPSRPQPSRDFFTLIPNARIRRKYFRRSATSFHSFPRHPHHACRITAMYFANIPRISTPNGDMRVLFEIHCSDVASEKVSAHTPASTLLPTHQAKPTFSVCFCHRVFQQVAIRKRLV